MLVMLQQGFQEANIALLHIVFQFQPYHCSTLSNKFFILFQEYIHRVGRTARGEGGVGNALLILQPDELGFIRYLRQAKVPVTEFEFSWSKVANIQNQVYILVQMKQVI